MFAEVRRIFTRLRMTSANFFCRFLTLKCIGMWIIGSGTWWNGEADRVTGWKAIGRQVGHQQVNY